VPVRRLAILFCVLALAPTAASDAARTDAWATHRGTSGGFTVSTPAAWVDVTRLTPQVLSKLRSLPNMEQYVAAVQRTHAVKLILIDAGAATVRNGFATNLNVAQVPTVGDLRLLHDVTLAQLRASSLVAGAIRSRYVTLPGGRAVELRYEARYASSIPTIAVRQYMFVRTGKATIVTFSTLPRLETQYTPLFLRSARSVRFS
jgi:hypothetical protein